MSTAFCFDLDGTVTQREILPAISSEIGIAEEMGALTDLTVSGVIPFEMSFRLRCLILRSIPVDVVQRITGQVEMHPQILEFIQARPGQCALMTGNLDVWVKPLVERCGCRVFASKAEQDDQMIGALTQVVHKGEAVREVRKGFDRVVAIGDGANDVLMFEEADIRIAFGGVHDPPTSLLKLADYVVYDGAALCRLLTTL